MSEVTKPLVLNETFANKLDTTNDILADIAYASSTKPNSWEEVRKIIRNGQGPRKFPVGTEFVVGRTKNMTATIGNGDGETPGITAASVTRDTFVHAMGESANKDYEFVYDGGVWTYNGVPVELTTYGISVTGTPILHDEIIIHETADKITWQVLGHNLEELADSQFSYSMTLGTKDVYTELQFDAREALFAVVGENALAAGTYHFLLAAQPWYASDVNKNMQFTLTQDVPVGGQIVLTNTYNATMIGASVKTYASANDTTEIEVATISEGTSGTDLGTVNNAKNTETGVNSIQRALNGNNNYAESAIRQYLNSAGAKTTFWAKQNVWDRKPSWFTDTDGFMYELDDDFIAATGKVKKVFALNTVCDGGGSIKITDRFFLLSRTEVYGGNENSIAEGSVYPFYQMYSDLSQAGTGADSNRIKMRAGTAKYWWLRSPYDGYAGQPRSCYTSGAVYDFNASNSRGVAPACVIY